MDAVRRNFKWWIKKLELKKELPESKKYIKTIVAFANTAGGKLIIGVSDDTKEIVGISSDIIFSIKDKITHTYIITYF